MKITDVKTKKELEENYIEIITCYMNKDKPDKMAIMFDYEQEVSQLMLGVSRINRVLAKALNIDFPDFLEMLKRATFFDERYGNLNLSEEQLKAMIDKDLKGFNIKK